MVARLLVGSWAAASGWKVYMFAPAWAKLCSVCLCRHQGER